MDFKITKKRGKCWELHLNPPVKNGIFESVVGHDDLVTLIHEELVKSDFTMWSRQAWDRWDWYDKKELDRFLTHFLLKHGGR